jgi:hypothetical protein
MNKLKIPEKIIEEYLKTGILAIGEYHGVQENYEVYKNILNSLPNIPNLAVEVKDTERIEFEKFLMGKEFNPSKFRDEGRLNLEFFNFLKYFKENYPNKKIIYFDEMDSDLELLKQKNFSRDEHMANNFLEKLEKPIIIIAGNLHLQKNIINLGNKQISPMGHLIKEKIGDFPFISVVPMSGSQYNYGVKELDIITDRNANEFYEKEDNKYLLFIEKATPSTPF